MVISGSCSSRAYSKQIANIEVNFHETKVKARLHSISISIIKREKTGIKKSSNLLFPPKEEQKKLARSISICFAKIIKICFQCCYYFPFVAAPNSHKIILIVVACDSYKGVKKVLGLVR